MRLQFSNISPHIIMLVQQASNFNSHIIPYSTKLKAYDQPIVCSIRGFHMINPLYVLLGVSYDQPIVCSIRGFHVFVSCSAGYWNTQGIK